MHCISRLIGCQLIHGLKQSTSPCYSSPAATNIRGGLDEHQTSAGNRPLLATHLAVPVSSVLAQTAGDVLKAYEALKKPERKMRLIEGAKKEGRLVFYGTLGVDASRPMLEKFRQSHPYISIDHYRSGSVGIYNRVINEARAGKHEVDIIDHP